MAKKKTDITFSVVKYSDGLVSVCPSSEINEKDKRISEVSDHDSYEDAVIEQRKYANAKKLQYQY